MMTWFLYINSVMIAFVLPLAWLRFFWWRLNIWGEAAGVLIGLPLGYIIWFPFGFSQQPLWVGFLLLFGAGWAVILLTTLLTPPESQETLLRFYHRCRPPGLWKPIISAFGPEKSAEVSRDFRHDLLTCAVGVLLCGSMVVLLNALVAQALDLILISATVMVTSGVVYIFRWRHKPLAHVAVHESIKTNMTT